MATPNPITLQVSLLRHSGCHVGTAAPHNPRAGKFCYVITPPGVYLERMNAVADAPMRGEPADAWFGRHPHGAIILHGRSKESVATLIKELLAATETPAPERDPDITVTVTRSAGTDGAVVVFIDTHFEPDASDDGPGLRVLINDHDTYAGKPFEVADEEREARSHVMTVALSELEEEA